MPLRWKPQINLRWLAFVVLAVALLLGWYRDHTEAEREMELLPKELAVLDGQMEDLRSRLAGHTNRSTELDLRKFSTIDMYCYSQLRPGVPRPFPLDVSRFLRDLQQSLEEDRPAKGMTAGLYLRFSVTQQLMDLSTASDERLDKVIDRVFDLLETPDPMIRVLTFRVVRLHLLHRRERLEPYIDRLVERVIRCLEYPDDEIRAESIECLRAIGPEADDARKQLQQIADNDPNGELKVQAILAIGAIDEEFDAIAAAKQWVRQRGESWERVVGELVDLLPAEDVAEYLHDQCAAAPNEAERQVFARALNNRSFRESSSAKRGR